MDELEQMVYCFDSLFNEHCLFLMEKTYYYTLCSQTSHSMNIQCNRISSVVIPNNNVYWKIKQQTCTKCSVTSF